MLTTFHFIIFLNPWKIISNLTFIPHFSVSQNFIQNVRKAKRTSILSITFIEVYFMDYLVANRRSYLFGVKSYAIADLYLDIHA